MSEINASDLDTYFSLENRLASNGSTYCQVKNLFKNHIATYVEVHYMFDMGFEPQIMRIIAALWFDRQL